MLGHQRGIAVQQTCQDGKLTDWEMFCSSKTELWEP